MCDESSAYRWYWLILPFLLETGKGENEKVLLALFMTTCTTKATSVKQAVEIFKSVGGFSVKSNYDHGRLVCWYMYDFLQKKETKTMNVMHYLY